MRGKIKKYEFYIKSPTNVFLRGHMRFPEVLADLCWRLLFFLGDSAGRKLPE